MNLSPGTRLGAYEITSPIGAGGMGEVYRARDTTLDRDVALKLLPAEFSTHPDRLARLEREAKTLASLNHPNIAQIYGLESAGGVRAIVMEFVEGEDLAERLRRGALPIDEALNAARQVAEALDAAHGAGVIHRDLKPANVKIRPDGAVKVLDFGLAKAASRENSADDVLANSPTMTSPLMTGVGVILGTAAYMAPEQAKGRPVDKRADVWGFGCLLFEMLSGQSLFAAEDVTETIAAVLTREPRWTQLPAGTPEPIQRLLRRCLVRDPRQRLSDIGVARLEIDDALSGAHATPVPRRLGRLWPVAIVAGVLGIAIGVAGMSSWLRTESPDTPVRVLPIATDPKITSAQLSPNGRFLAYVRGERLVVRSIESGDEQEVPEDRVSNPFWSWDSSRVAYFRRGEFGTELRFVPANVGASQVLLPGAQATKGRPSPVALWGGTWCEAGIVFLDAHSVRALRMLELPSQKTSSFGKSDSGSLAYPHCLPDGRILAIRSTPDTAEVVVVSRTETVVLLKQNITNRTDVRWPVLVGSDVVFEQTDPTQGLWTFPVNADLTEPTGAPRLVKADATRPSAGDGMLTALTGVHAVDRNLVLVDRSGNKIELFGKSQREFLTPSLSPDESKVISGGRRQTVEALWQHTKDTVQRWHQEDRGSWTAWSPNGARIAFVVGNDNVGTENVGTELIVRTAAGDERQVVTTNARGPNWINDDELVFFRGTGLWRVAAKEGATPQQIPTGIAREASFSPNGKLIAYAINTGSGSEVFVAQVDHLENATQISIDGGRYPLWTKAGLYYACGDPEGDTPGASRALCFAPVDPTSGIMRGKPTQLFDAPALGFKVITYSQRGYDVSRDGARILVQTAGLEGTPSITLIENAKSWLKSR